MRIKLLSNIAGPDVSGYAGAVLDLDEPRAVAFVSAGAATALEVPCSICGIDLADVSAGTIAAPMCETCRTATEQDAAARGRRWPGVRLDRPGVELRDTGARAAGDVEQLERERSRGR